MDHSDTNSAEYRALICLSPALQLAVESQLTSLGAELIGVGLITPDDYNWLTNPSLQKDDQAAYLVRLIQHKVQQDPQCYQTFIAVLKKDESQYNGIAGSLQRTVTMLRRQRPSSTHLGDSLLLTPSTSYQWINPSPQQHFLPGPSRLPSQAGGEGSAHMEQNLQSFPGIHTESQQSSTITKRSIPFYPNQFPIVNSSHCLPSLLGGSLLPFTTFQWIHPSLRQLSLPGPSGLLQDKSVMVTDLAGTSSHSEASHCSPRLLHGHKPKEPQYIYISSGEESNMEEESQDETVTAGVGGGYGVPCETTSCVAGPTVHLTTDANSYVSKNELGTKAAQQEDNGRSGGSSDDVNNANIKKDENVIAGVSGDHGVPSESNDCAVGPTIHPTTSASSCVGQDKRSTPATQQQDNGRSGGSSDNVNNAGSKKAIIDDIPKLHELDLFEQCSVLIRIIDRVAPKWKEVALRLHFEDHRIQIIEMKCYHQPVPACRTMFTQWLEGNGRKPTSWKTLTIALKEAKLSTLAEELEKTFSDSLSTTVSNQTSSSEAPAVVSRKRPSEKSTEEVSGKRPHLESSASETNSVNILLVSIELTKSNPLLKHRPKLAAFYSHQPEVPEGTWPPVKKTQYINLALIRTEQAIDFNKEFLCQTIRGSVDDIMKDKDDVKYDEVFTEVEEGARLVFEGRPGCGKTTMMNKVSQDWANGKIFVSSLLFLVHLRRFGNRSDIDLETLLRSTPVEFSDEEFKEMCTQIKVGQGKGTVFTLDGLDEYCSDKKKYKSTFIHKLIKGEILPKSTVIVASRPAASQKFRKNATKCIEVLGFLKQQIYEYINSYFDEDQNKVLGLRIYLEHHPNVMHMCYLPLHMAMVSYLYDIEGASLPQTETEIYNHFTLSTLVRSIKKKSGMELDEPFYLSSFEGLSSGDKRIFDLILELAYQATVVEARQVFSHNDVQNFFNKQSSNTGNDESSLGLVVVDWSFVKYGLEEIYTFLHLTFQEYLAACHIIQLSSQAQEEVILKYGGDKKLGVVWKFYCGMTQFSDGQKMNNFKQLFEKTKSNVLHQLHCAHESQQDILCTHVVELYNSIVVLNKLSLNPSDFTALGYVLTRSNVPTTELAITSCHISPEGLAALMKAINECSLSLKVLSFHRTKIRGVIPEFCGVLKQCPQLCSLIISNCDIINEVLSEMAKMLPRLELLEQLDLSSNNLGKMSTMILESMLIKLPKLKILWPKSVDLLLFKIANERGIEINVINKESSKISKQELLRFDHGKTFRLEDINFISNYFQAHQCTAALIQEIILNRNSIGDAGAQALAGGLQHCTNLQELK